MSGDRLWLLGLESPCRIGVPDWERRKPQRLRFDVGLSLDLRPACRSDALERSVDYQALRERLLERTRSGERRLLERLAQELAEEALAFDRRVRAVEVRLSKWPSVMPGQEVRVEIVRPRRRA